MQRFRHPRGHRHHALRFVTGIACCVLSIGPPVAADEPRSSIEATALRGALIRPSDANAERLRELESSGTNTIVFPVSGEGERSKVSIRKAVAQVQRAGLAFGYWIEVARCPELADARPSWMASLQTHDEWRRFFPDAPEPKSHEVAKTYPWVPILSKEPFDAQKKRVLASLSDLPTPRLILLNDLQGGPSACGCGNPLCRWTSDYGKRRTTTPLGDDAAARFVEAIESSSPRSEVIPVWTTECEEHDGHPDGMCAGVGCFAGICWKAYTRQLMPVAKTSERIGVLALYKAFGRNVATDERPATQWVEFAVQSFQIMPSRKGAESIPSSRIVAIVQGWDVSKQEIEDQISAAANAGANGCVVAYDEIDQSWSPKILPWQ